MADDHQHSLWLAKKKPAKRVRMDLTSLWIWIPWCQCTSNNLETLSIFKVDRDVWGQGLQVLTLWSAHSQQVNLTTSTGAVKYGDESRQQRKYIEWSNWRTQRWTWCVTGWKKSLRESKWGWGVWKQMFVHLDRLEKREWKVPVRGLQWSVWQKRKNLS